MTTFYVATDAAGLMHFRTTASRTYTHVVVALDSYEHALTRATIPGKWLRRNFEFFKSQGETHNLNGCATAAEYEAKAVAEDVAYVQAHEHEYAMWMDCGWCGRLDLAQKSVTKFRAMPRTLTAVALEARAVTRQEFEQLQAIDAIERKARAAARNYAMPSPAEQARQAAEFQAQEAAAHAAGIEGNTPRQADPTHYLITFNREAIGVVAVDVADAWRIAGDMGITAQVSRVDVAMTREAWDQATAPKGMSDEADAELAALQNAEAEEHRAEAAPQGWGKIEADDVDEDYDHQDDDQADAYECRDVGFTAFERW